MRTILINYRITETGTSATSPDYNFGTLEGENPRDVIRKAKDILKEQNLKSSCVLKANLVTDK